MEDLCVFPQVKIPAGFKILDFVKYDRTTNLEFHLKAYCLTMEKWGRNEKLFLAHFHFSLTGFAFQWYIRLGKESLRPWHDMVQAFLKQFKHSKIELTNPRYDLMLVVPFEDFPQLITMGKDIDFKTQEGHMAPLIRTQLSTMRGREIPDDPISFANHLIQPMSITLNTSALSVVPHRPTKTSPFSLNVPYLPPLLEYQKAIKLFNFRTIPSTYSPSLLASCIAIHPSISVLTCIPLIEF
ncbi:putative Gag-pro [Senna tora]|uniref:Putative Gag-pro n=1 Tax=Senna tora TaxID=362788 RepID=A0A834TUA8_9FABA|nr:putative Gag-pro [Senna tora]